jgi:ferredoxin-like protein FixX
MKKTDTATDYKKMLADIRENNRRWRECPRHLYRAWDANKHSLGQKHTCLNCGSSKSLTDIGCYIEGYKAAGGDPNDIMPGYA